MMLGLKTSLGVSIALVALLLNTNNCAEAVRVSFYSRKDGSIDRAASNARQHGRPGFRTFNTGGPHSGLTTEAQVNEAPLVVNEASLVRSAELTDIEAALANPYVVIFGQEYRDFNANFNNTTPGSGLGNSTSNGGNSTTSVLSNSTSTSTSTSISVSTGGSSSHVSTGTVVSIVSATLSQA